jgi:hypothetical protein
MSSRTQAPTSVGTYSNRPTWAIADPFHEDGYLMWERNVAEIYIAGIVKMLFSVAVCRRDDLGTDTFDDLGEPYVFVSVEAPGDHLTPAQARQLASALVQSADLVES